MPINKNALLRYQILDRCFSDCRHRYEIHDLLDKVNEASFDHYGTTISIRQVRADIAYMRNRVAYNAPVKAYPFDGKKCYYRYTDTNFSIFNNKLSAEEVSKLRSTIEMLSRYRGISDNAWLEEVISSLEYRFGIKPNKENIVSFEQNESLIGLEYLSDMIDSAVNHQPLQISYCSYNGKKRTAIVHPYHLKQYNNRWFLFGLEENKQYGNRIANMALDRIVAYSHPADIAFIPNDDIDFSTYFNDVIGVTIPNDHPEPEKVVLKFDGKRFPYIVSKPLHASQEVISNEEHTLYIKVRPNKELEAVIFSFGNQVEVLEPEWLRLQIAEKNAENYKKYFSVQKTCTEE
jgi:predicted DNA-binding transcriptional regulator YafY